VNLDACDPSWDGWDRPSTSGRWGGVNGAGPNPYSVTGVLAGLGRMTGIPLSGRCIPARGEDVGLPGPP
jgi:hypothetical protein